MAEEIKKEAVKTEPKIEENGRLRIQNIKRVEDKYKDSEKMLIDKMIKQTIGEIETKSTEPVKEEKNEPEKVETGKDDKESEKEDEKVKFLLSELIGLDKEPEKKEENKEEIQEEQEELTDAEKRYLEAERKLEVIEASDKIEELLGNYDEQEKEILRDKMVKLLEKGMYQKLSNDMNVEEKTAYLLVMAKGLATDEMKKIVEEEAEAKSVFENATRTPQGKQRDKETQEKERSKLVEMARNGDKRATIALNRSDPVIDSLIAKAKKI